MDFSIITPSFRSSAWLKLCINSVADQQGISFEHIVQDSCSDDGTQDWLPQDKRVQAFIEKDAGMYDAINRGFRRSSGDLLAYLNCDEQYLPGALHAVRGVFENNPEVDLVLADTVVVDVEGNFICCRKSLVPWRLTSYVFLPFLTSAIFFRRRLLTELNLYFDSRWRDVADDRWLKEAMAVHVRMKVLRRYTSVFTDTGENMNLKPNAIWEKKASARRTPGWGTAFRWPLLQLHRMRAVCHRLYWEKPFSYSLYTKRSPNQRQEVFVPKPTGVWWARHESGKGPGPAPVQA
jgi:glycosyltransferase involved in cell wall biosynthesis